MTKYKRWILLLTALTVFVVHIESLKATSLIHAAKYAKVNTTATNVTTSSTTEEAIKEGLPEIYQKEEGFVEVNGSRVALTGIPQIDYVWDPNLPRELNGFNLSSYPFLDSMPSDEDIDFDCEERINGFYASIKFGCQLYHHCLYGVRTSFICANFTAFDQKTFICHFASEVDCKNSYKYWHRNDDLYKATTEKPSAGGTAGLSPLFDRNLYKRPAPGSSSVLNGGSSANRDPPTNLNADPPRTQNTNPLPSRNNNNNNNNKNIGNDDFANPIPLGQRTPARPLRRPYRRRRPQVDYYYYDDDYEEEFYDDRGRRRQQRPRNRRPMYDDEYDMRRPDNRRPLNDDFDDYEYDRRPYRSRNRSESRRQGDDRRKNDDRRFDDRRRPNTDERRPVDDRRRPVDERRSYDDTKASDSKRHIDDHDEKGLIDDRKLNRRKNYDDQNEDRRRDRFPERSETTEKKQPPEDLPSEEKVVKAIGSLFDRPRAPPKISRPVPLSEKNKFAYKAPEKIPTDAKNEEEYYEDYEDAPVPSSSTTTTTTTTTLRTTTKYLPRLKTITTPNRRTTTTPSTTTAEEIEYYDDEVYEDSVTPTKYVETTTILNSKDNRAAAFHSRNRQTSNDNLSSTAPPSVTAKPSAPDNFRAYRFKSPSEKLINQTTVRDTVQKPPYVEESSLAPISSTTRKALPSIGGNKKFANQQTVFESTTTETPKPITLSNVYNISPIKYFSKSNEQPEASISYDDKEQKSIVRVVKRPFLPSRGGNPYKGRGLQPVGPASLQADQLYDNNSQFTAPDGELPSAPNDNTHQHSQHNNDQKFLSINSDTQPQQYRSDTHKTTLDDIYNEEYDVELNDALNPMLKPLTSSRGISGFSFSSLPNDDKDGLRSQSQKSIQRAVAPSSSTTTTTEPQYEYEEVEYEY